MLLLTILAKLRCLILAIVSVALVGASIATDFVFRHEIRGQARRELHQAGLEVNVQGIIRAIERGNLEFFENFDIAGISFGGADDRGMTPLHAAITARNEEAIERLFKRREEIEPTVNIECRDGFTPIKRALNDSNFELADRLIELGAEMPLEKSPGLPWLIDAMDRDDSDLRDYLFEKSIDVNQKGAQPNYPLALAADDDDLPLMKQLVSRGADVNIAGVSGKPLILEATLDNQFEEMVFLLENGADPDAAFEEMSPLTVALQREDGYMKDLLLRHGASVDREGLSGKHFLFEAAESGDHDWMLYLLESGIPVDLKSQTGETLLTAAVKDGDYQMLDFLIEQEADLNQKDKKGVTPLESAVSQGDTAAIRTLVESGAHLNFPKLAAIAYQRRDNPTMNLLLNAGMNPNTKIKGTQKTLLDAAVADGAVETVETLLRAKAEVGDNLWTALETKQDNLVTLLLSHGADPSQIGPQGKTALEYVLNEKRFSLVPPILNASEHSSPMFDARETWISRTVRNGDTEIAVQLIKAGIDLGDEKAADGQSLLGWAIANETDDIALALIEAGVDVNIVEQTPAEEAFIEKFDESTLFRKLLKNDRNIRPLMMTSVKRNHKVAQAMVKAGGKNLPSSKYYYPISIASWYSDVRMMQILYGRNPDVQPRKLVIDLSSQRVQLYVNGRVTYSSVCSTGKKGFETPVGTYVITQKNKDHVSNLYDAAMPYFMRLSCRDFGLHVGHCPGYPASHGCIRLPSSAAVHYYRVCSMGDLVEIRR